MNDAHDDAGAPRVIGPASAISIVAGSMLGIGIFLTPRVVAGELHTAPLFLLAWLLGGLIALSGAVAYAELGVLFPKAGGDYVFLREAFGRSTSFAAGWLLFVGVFVGSIATMAVPVCLYQLPALLAPFVSVDMSAPATLFGAELPISGAQSVAIQLVAVLTVVNLLGTRLAAWTQIVLTMVPFAVLGVGALWVLFGGGDPTPVVATEVEPTSSGLAVSMTKATLAIYFAYAGWNAVGYVGGEVRNPGRNIPIGLLGGTALITVLYLVMCGAFIVALGMGGLTQAFEAGTATAAAVGGPRLQYLVTALIALALFGSLNGTILAGARIAWAMAGDGALPVAFRSLTSRQTPGVALVAQAVLAAALILSGTFETLLELTSVAMLVMGSLAVISVFVFRARMPDAPRPYRATGYPVLPAFYLLVSAIVIGVSLYRVAVPGADGPEGIDRFLPVFGLVVFAAAWLGHRVVRR